MLSLLVVSKGNKLKEHGNSYMEIVIIIPLLFPLHLCSYMEIVKEHKY